MTDNTIRDWSTVDIDDRFIEAMRDKRREVGMSQAALARALTDREVPHMSQASVQSIEAGKRRVTLGEATMIAHILGFEIPGVQVADDVFELRALLDKADLVLKAMGR